MSIDVIPTKIEGYDTEMNEGVFTVTAEDEASATVTITACVNVEAWDEISAKVREALVMMKLETGEGPP